MAFQRLTGDVAGPIEVTGELEVEGTITGGVEVRGFLDLIGTCEGPLVVHDGGNADVEAVVRGDVRVAAGRLRLRGIVEGTLGATRDSDVALAVGTVIGGRQLLPDGSLLVLTGPAHVEIPDDAPLLHLSSDGTWQPHRVPPPSATPSR